jgi:hypothetical protein
MNGALPHGKNGRTSIMNKFTKIAAGTLAALTLTAGVLATSSDAQAFPKKGWGPGIGFGIAAGVIGAAAYGAYAAPGYYVAPDAVSCRYVERYDVYGNYRGTRKVCDIVE